MAHTERTRATWTLSNIRAEAERLLADIRLDPTARADTANQVAELAIRRCVKITPTRYRAGQAGDDPALVSRAGRSTFDDPTLDRYTSQTILDMEKRVMATFGRTDPLAWGPGEGTRLIQSMRAGGNRLSDDQAKAAAYLLENPHAASALIGPAGTGKTTTMRAVARAWETRHGRGSVLGLTLSVRARDELADSIGTNAITIAKLLDNVSERHRAQTDDLRREYRCRLAAARTPAERDRIRRAISESDAREQAGLIHPGQLVIVDEAGMVGTPELDAIAELCERAGARLALTGDPMQLDAPAAPGGLLAWAEREHRCATLTSLWRFRSDPRLWANDPDGGRARWADEGKATLRLRAGGDRAKPDSVEACRRLVAEYAAHHRLHWGEDRECEEEAYRMTLQWQKTGKTTLLVAGTNEQVRAMNQRTILERRVLGLSDGDPSRLATLSDGLKIGAGDRIVSRANDHQVRGPDGHRIENGMAFTVTRIDTDAIACRDADGRQWTIPRDWVKTNCEAGYATTIHKSQGMTVDRCAAMFPSDARVPCNLQYVAATRGREENHLLYACKDEKTRQTEAMLSGSDTDPEAIARQRMLSTLLTRRHRNPHRRTRGEIQPDTTPARTRLRRRPHRRPPPRGQTPPMPQPGHREHDHEVPELGMAARAMVPRLDDRPQAGHGHRQPRHQPQGRARKPAGPRRRHGRPAQQRPARPAQRRGARRLDRRHHPAHQGIQKHRRPRPGAPERTPHHPTGRRPRPTGRHGRTALVEDRHGNGAETRRPQPAARRGHLPGHVAHRRPRPAHRAKAAGPVRPAGTALVQPRRTHHRTRKRRRQPRQNPEGQP